MGRSMVLVAVTTLSQNQTQGGRSCASSELVEELRRLSHIWA